MRDYLYNLATDRYAGFIAAAIKFILFILSLIYGLIVSVLVLFNRWCLYRINCQVISVGNITLGGTGKTSLVEFTAKYLKKQGHKVAVISRGYKRKIPNLPLSAGSKIQNYEIMGDEPYMLSKNLGGIPVIVDANRIRAAGLAIRNYGVDTVILDDGFQQWKIKKDLEMVAIDATNPFGNQHLIPRGILREPLSSLKRADVFILTKTNLMPNVVNQTVSLRRIQDIKDFLSRINPTAEIFESIHKPLGFYEIGKDKEVLGTDVLKGKIVTLATGIADPDSFESLIAMLGINVGLSFRFPDHYHYVKEDLDKIVKGSRDKKIDTVVTTEKDAARFQSLPLSCLALSFLVLRIGIVITKDEQKFYNRLLRLYSI
jgi:tetraacyldisaccharide 4'-kinase